MNAEELAFLSCTEQGRLIRERRLSPVELVQVYLDRIRRWDGKLRSYITVCEESALREAREAEAEIAKGRYRGPLHGLPYGVKDQIHAKGVPTTLGTRVLRPEEMMPDHDATVIERLREQGAILLGKHNLHEFGKGGTIDFPYGQPRNPWNLAHTPSSSSSGSGIAPAAGLCSFALGEDTGGSIRGPASCNGVVGMRPTYGRVSRYGGVMEAYTSDTIGPLARTVADCALVLEAIAGHDPRDPLSSTRPVPRYVDHLRNDLRGIKLAVVREIAWSRHVHPEVVDAMRRAIAVLEDLGATVEEISLPYVRFAVPLQLLTSDVDVATMFLRKYLRTRWDAFDRGTRTRLAAACLVPATVYNRAMRARVIVRRQVLDALRVYDGLLGPTTVTPPKRIEAMQEKVESVEDVATRLLERRISTYPFSLANVPAISVPAGFGTDGLPLALQIAGKPFREEVVLRIAHAYEQATPWHARHPDLSKTAA